MAVDVAVAGTALKDNVSWEVSGGGAANSGEESGGAYCCGNRLGLYFVHQVQLEFLLLGPRGRLVFSESVKDVQLELGGPPGSATGAASGWRAVTSVLRSTTHDMVNMLFPSDCRVCGGPVLALSGAQVCEACVARVDAQTDTEVLCRRCGDALGMESARFAGALGIVECTMCRMAPPAFERAVAFATYDDEVREMLHLLKFNGMQRIAKAIFADGMASAVMQLADVAASEVVVVPVPLFGARERARGFNQARLLAEVALERVRKLSPAWKLTMLADVLARVKDTNASFALDPRARRKNLQGAFRVTDVEAVRGREVLLVDDIMTTGATARECARVLRSAGAAKVWVVTMARAQEEKASRETDVARWDAIAVQARLREPDVTKRQGFVQ